MDKKRILLEAELTGKPQRLLIFPRGNHYIEKYDSYLNFNDEFFAEIMEGFTSDTLAKPYIDKQHKFGESYGDITSLIVDELGMYADIVLNPEGIEAIQGREYRYISPSFGQVIDNNGRVYNNALMAISLTNIPALNGAMPQIQDQINLDKTMDAIQLAFTLTADGGVQSVGNIRREAEMESIKKHFALEKETSEAVVLEKIKSIELENTQSKEKIVSLEKTVTDQKTELETIKKVELEKEAKSVVLEAIKNGQYLPALESLKVEQYLLDSSVIKKELELIPVKKSEQKSGGNVETGLELTEKEMAIMLDRKMDPTNPEQVKKFKEYIK